jgi:predicted RNA-binding Zn-ribbon protein involved in translation (DUF1610 family)
MNRYNSRRALLDDDLEPLPFERVRSRQNKVDLEEPRRKAKDFKRFEQAFKCASCGAMVSTARESSGVNNRNHCPLCLCSRHVDEFKAGDRLATCHSRMPAIGLTFKRSPQKFTRGAPGELMLIHHCAGCGKIAINRAAADDDAAQLYRLSLVSLELGDGLLEELAAQGIQPLDAAGFNAAYAQIYGRQPIEIELVGADALVLKEQ